MITDIRVTPRQYVQTVAGNFALKVTLHLGYHAAHYGRRTVDFYIRLANETIDMCRQHSMPFTGLPAFLSDADLGALQRDAMLAVAEIGASLCDRLRTDTDGFLTEAADFWRNSQEFRDYRHTATRLPEKDIVDLIIDSSDGEYVSRIDSDSLKIDQRRFELPDSDRYFKESGTKLVFETLEDDENIHCLMNIGSRIDPTLYFCAKKFPDRKFLGFDFQHNLRRQNEVAFGEIPENLFFASGYALEALDRGLKVDAVFFMATSVLFTVSELSSYLDLMRRNGVRKVIISESWASPIDGYDCGAIIRPEEVPLERPFLGGTILNAQQNYIAQLEQAGYKVERSAIIDDHFGGWYNILQTVATLKPAVARPATGFSLNRLKTRLPR